MVETQLTFKCLSMKPHGQTIFKTKTFGDKIIINRPETGVFNLILGERYFHHYGTLKAKNTKTGDTAEIKLKEKSFFGSPDTTCEGFIKDASGATKYKIEGDWKSHISILDAQTGRKVTEMKKVKDLPRAKENHEMPLITRNANMLTVEDFSSVCPTDSRFRSDQRAAEFGDYDLANQEKARLEEIQFAREDEWKETGEEWRPRWFEKVFDQDIGEEIWAYKGGYFEARKTGEWKDVADIY